MSGWEQFLLFNIYMIATQYYSAWMYCTLPYLKLRGMLQIFHYKLHWITHFYIIGILDFFLDIYLGVELGYYVSFFLKKIFLIF